MPSQPYSPHELPILEHIEADPEVTQAGLAEKLGVAVGTVNFVVKRLVKKGYIKVTHLQRKRLKYIITPEGIALRSRLAMESLKYSMRLYRETREQARALLAEVKRQGHTCVQIEGEGDLADIAQLTCLELGLSPQTGPGAPVVLAAQIAPLTLHYSSDPKRRA